MFLFRVFAKESLACFPLERRNGAMPFRYHGLLIKRSHVASSPSIWIDKDFWFQSSPSPPTPFFPLSLLSLPLSSFILCIFGIERLGEKERERARAKKNNGRRAQERERDSFGVKGEVLVSSFLLLLSDWPFTQSWLRPERVGCVPFRWRSRKRRG